MKTTRRILFAFVRVGVLAGCAGIQPAADDGAMTWLMHEDDPEQGGE